MGEKGLEPLILTEYDSESYAYTSSATRPLRRTIAKNVDLIKFLFTVISQMETHKGGPFMSCKSNFLRQGNGRGRTEREKTKLLEEFGPKRILRDISGPAVAPVAAMFLLGGFVSASSDKAREKNISKVGSR